MNTRLVIHSMIRGDPTGIRGLAKTDDGTLRPLFRLKAAQSDCSIYLWPYGLTDEFHFGKDRFAETERARTFKFRGQLESEEAPHVSIHESGQVNVRLNPRVGETTQATPLATLQGDLIATLRIDMFRALTAHVDAVRTEEDWRDVVWSVPGSIDFLRVVFSARAVPTGRVLGGDSFVAPKDPVIGWPRVLGISRPGCRLEVCIQLVDNKRWRNNARAYQSTIVAGWDLQRIEGEELHFVFLTAL